MDLLPKKKVLLLITNSYAAINVIHSGLIKPLADAYEVYLLSSVIHRKEILEINAYFNVRIQRVDISAGSESLLIKVLRRVQKAIFFSFFNISTQKVKEKQMGFWHNIGFGTAMACLRFCRLENTLLKFLRRKIICLSGQRSGLDQLLVHNFHGVISSSPLDIRENAIVNFLKYKNVRSLAIIISWDNLTSKGMINADHDYLLVWNEPMRDEYQRFYSLYKQHGTQICIAGVARFDIYLRNAPTEHSGRRFRKKYTISRDDKIILFGTGAIGHFRAQTDIVHHLSEYASIRQNVKVIVRCHPGDNFQRYHQFINHPNLIICYPANPEKKISVQDWMPHLQMQNTLAEQLKHCDVCVNIASTLRLEAAACNRPGIAIAYDGNSNKDFLHSVRRFYAYSHQIPLNGLGIDTMVHSQAELYASLDDILYLHPLLNPNFRDRIRRFIHHSKPEAVATTMNYIRQWLN